MVALVVTVATTVTAGEKGNWGLRRRGIDDLAGCVARCRTCARCRFVSFSLAHDECGWFHSCPLPLELAFQGNTYVTVRVRHNRTAGTRK